MEIIVRKYDTKDIKEAVEIWNEVVEDCIKTGKLLGFQILQFNAVVKANTPP